MRTITVENNLYTYNELSADAQRNVKNWYLNEFHTPDIFADMIASDLQGAFGADMELDTEFSLNYCQGDGLNIYGKIDAGKILDFMGSDCLGELSAKYKDALAEDEKDAIRRYCEFDNGYYHDFGIVEVPKNNSCLYSYCCAENIDIADSWSTEMEYFGVIHDYDLLKKFENVVIDIFTELCDMYKQWGYDYFYEIDDEDMENECEINDWEFDVDGHIV